jgi:transposase-like protein
MEPNKKDMTFEEQITQAIQRRIIADISEANLLSKWGQREHKIPEDLIEKAWESINWDEVAEVVRKNMQNKICNSIVGNLSTEVGTDTKKLMSIPGFREGLRATAYPAIKALIGKVNE